MFSRFATLCVLLGLIHPMLSAQKKYCLLVGTYTSGKSKGIYTYFFDVATGSLQIADSVHTPNPSFLAVSANKRFVYAVNQQNTDTGSYAVAFSLNAAAGKLQLINRQTVNGAGPCYIAVDNKNQWLFTGNYTSGSLSVLPLNKDGSIQPLAQLIKQKGSSIVASRQQSSHVHAAVLDPSNQYLLVPDLGTDKIYKYRLNSKQTAAPLQTPSDSVIVSKPGNGPRHIAFHPNGKVGYVINELSGTIDAWQYQAGACRLLQTISTDSSNKADKGSADIHVSPDGKHLYATNRGSYNSIATYAINNKTGELTFLGVQSTLGATPRNFVIDPTGNYVLVANQKSDSIVVFKRDVATGILQPTGTVVNVGNPVCLLMVPTP